MFVFYLLPLNFIVVEVIVELEISGINHEGLGVVLPVCEKDKQLACVVGQVALRFQVIVKVAHPIKHSTHVLNKREVVGLTRQVFGKELIVVRSTNEFLHFYLV